MDKNGWQIERVVSGGQTGVDRSALDVAIELGIPHGGWCPLGRLAEDGRIPSRYTLREIAAAEYWVRTEQNVIDSDGTLILYRGELSGGTAFTYRMTIKHQRPSLLVNLSHPVDRKTVRDWLARHRICCLNIAGPRESSVPGIGEEARAFLKDVLPNRSNTGGSSS